MLLVCTGTYLRFTFKVVCTCKLALAHMFALCAERCPYVYTARVWQKQRLYAHAIYGNGHCSTLSAVAPRVTYLYGFVSAALVYRVSKSASHVVAQRWCANL